MGSPTIKDVAIRRILKQNVRRILATRDISENALARRTRISQKHINNITNARSGCGIDALGYIAKELGVPPWSLLTPPRGH